MNRIINVSTVSIITTALIFAAVLFIMPTAANAFGISGDGGCCGGGSSSSNSSSYTPPPTYGSGCSSNCGYTPPPPPAPTCSLSVSPSQVENGGSVNINWSTSNATSVSLSGFGSVSNSGSQTDSNLLASKTYTLVASGNGGSVTCTKTVTVKPPKPAPTCTINASQTNIQPGQSVTINWTSQNATAGSLSSYGNIALNSSATFSPSQTTTYTATFTSQSGQTVTCSTTVVVTILQCPSGYSGSYPNCTPPPVVPSCNIYLNQYNSYNTNTNYNNQYQYQPQNGYVINWTSSNASYGFINNGIGSVGLSGNRTVYPTQTTVYTATFIGQNNQQITCSVTVNVNTYVPPPVYQNPAPYITLAAVPYTGLDLGPVGTTLYWGFIIVCCLFAAYLIAIKRVHMKLARWYNEVLFGEETRAHAPHAVQASTNAMTQTELVKLANMLRSVIDGAPASHTTTATAVETDGTDAFIVSQIHRGRHA